jgi:hypothetical protein
MDFKKRLSQLTNLKIHEDLKDIKNLSIQIMVFESSLDLNKKLVKKELTRDLKISSLFGEEFTKNDESQKKINGSTPDFITNIDEGGNFPEIRANIKSIKLESKDFVSWEDTYNQIIEKIDSISKLPHLIIEEKRIFPNWKIGNVKLENRIKIASNKIAITSRVGPGNVALVGKNVDQYLDRDLIPHMDIIVDEKIDPNKIIVMRIPSDSQDGIHLVVDGEKKFFFSFPENFDEISCWFWIE